MTRAGRQRGRSSSPAQGLSRGESVEIGGSFRVPDVMERSGARLVDVGTTNRTRLDDYRRAVERDDVDAALVLGLASGSSHVDDLSVR